MEQKNSKTPFLYVFWTQLALFFRLKVAERLLPETEVVARFIFNDDHISKSNNTPKQGAFLPEEYRGRYETSVCRRALASLDRLWTLGKTIRAKDRKAAIAAAELYVSTVIEAKLQANSAPMRKYHEHAVLVGWPSGEKHERKAIAAKLVYHSKLIKP